MQLTILEDGTISIQTGDMAGEHHASADESSWCTNSPAAHVRRSPHGRIISITATTIITMTI